MTAAEFDITDALIGSQQAVDKQGREGVRSRLKQQSSTRTNVARTSHISAYVTNRTATTAFTRHFSYSCSRVRAALAGPH